MALTSPSATRTETPSIHPATRLGHVHYTTANLNQQIDFYRDILGFKLHWREENRAGLGAGGEDLLRLTENGDARQARGTTGLYHTAFLVPSRWQLAHLIYRIAQTRTPIQGLSNHGTHLAIYLPDAENNGIELAWDFPKEQWPKTAEEMIQGNHGFDPQALVSTELQADQRQWEGLDKATTVGHVHLHVAHIAPTQHFYHDVLRFDIPFVIPGGSAVFFSAGGYHHHIGTNIWQGVGAPPPPATAVGLRYYTVVLPDDTVRSQVLERVREAGIPVEETNDGILVRDPAQNGLMLSVETAS